MSPTLSVARPGRSIRRLAFGSVDSGAKRATINIPIATSGRFIKKITRQSSSTSTPPTSGPTASAEAETPAQIPSAFGTSASGKALQTRASERVSTGAAPTPCRIRPPISTSGSLAIPETTEPTPKANIPSRKIGGGRRCRRAGPR